MRNTIVLLLGLLCSLELFAAEPLIPETFLTSCGAYQHKDGNRSLELTIQSNKLRVTASDSSHNNSAETANWSAAKRWFVYVGKDMRVWAYDGHKELWLLKADPLGSEVTASANLQEQPPTVVLKRLPRALRKALIQTSLSSHPEKADGVGVLRN
ncbi:MAG TPA: hypothetical protein VEC99_18670 [Clostridia bacterium]|nr:hypothetical protein [Clostridia bacterium]